MAEERNKLGGRSREPDSDTGTASWERRRWGIDPNSEIGAKLRALYGSVEEESIPERFLDLLERLDKAERNGVASGAD